MTDDRPQAAAPSSGAIRQLFSDPLPQDRMELLSTFAPTTESQETIYLSTPITTGPSLLRWRVGASAIREPNAEGYREVRDRVKEENLEGLKPLRDRLTRTHPNANLIDPTVLSMAEWTQPDYHRFWIEVIATFVDRIVFADGWTLSTGCVIEYATGLELGIEMTDSTGKVLEPEIVAGMLADASSSLREAHLDTSFVDKVRDRAEIAGSIDLKDAQLARLAESHNVAKFFSTTPGNPVLRFSVLSEEPTRRSIGVRKSIEQLLRASAANLVNVRTFRPGVTKGNPFYYGLGTVEEVLERVWTAAEAGFYCIVNETIDVADGGVSGVTLGGVTEFSPDGTPRVVEESGTARFPIVIAEHVLRHVYGSSVTVPADRKKRIEFSVHPQRVGNRGQHVIVWESEEVAPIDLEADILWPNRFSELIGDKTFGLLIADAFGLSVPQSTVISRRVAPFRFGTSPGTGEWWMRTAPAKQSPGQFTTTRGWTDPFATLAHEDPAGAVASVLCQEAVDAVYSGATLPLDDGSGHLIEGVAGSGDSFMLGAETATELPLDIQKGVLEVLEAAEGALGGPVRIEWAADRDRIWVLQLHRIQRRFRVGVFYPGSRDTWLAYDPIDGLDVLKTIVRDAKRTGAGVEVVGPVGLTSHVGDLLRKAEVPSRLRALE